MGLVLGRGGRKRGRQPRGRGDGGQGTDLDEEPLHQRERKAFDELRTCVLRNCFLCTGRS